MLSAAGTRPCGIDKTRSRKSSRFLPIGSARFRLSHAKSVAHLNAWMNAVWRQEGKVLIEKSLIRAEVCRAEVVGLIWVR